MSCLRGTGGNTGSCGRGSRRRGNRTTGPRLAQPARQSRHRQHHRHAPAKSRAEAGPPRTPTNVLQSRTLRPRVHRHRRTHPRRLRKVPDPVPSSQHSIVGGDHLVAEYRRTRQGGNGGQGRLRSSGCRHPARGTRVRRSEDREPTWSSCGSRNIQGRGATHKCSIQLAKSLSSFVSWQVGFPNDEGCSFHSAVVHHLKVAQSPRALCQFSRWLKR